MKLANGVILLNLAILVNLVIRVNLVILVNLVMVGCLMCCQWRDCSREAVMSFQKRYSLYGLNCLIVEKGKVGCDCGGIGGSGGSRMVMG